MPRRKASAYKNQKSSDSKKKADCLSATEKKEVKEIIAAKKELRYCNRSFFYDDYDIASGYLQLTRTNPVALPGITPTGTNAATMLGFQTGEYLNSESQSINTNVGAGTMAPLGGFGMIQGTDSVNILADYAYLQSSKVDLQITALPIDTNQSYLYSPGMSGLQFRVLHIQAKQIQTGVSPSYTNGLFWDRTHDKIGLTMVGTNKELFKDFHLNTDQFHILHDVSFRLTQPQDPASLDTHLIQNNLNATASPQVYVNQSFQGQATNPTYPCAKDLSFWMPKINKKIRFSENDDLTSNAYEPTNTNFVNMIFILCCRTNQQGLNSDLLNTGRAWSCKAAMETRYRDA